MAPGNGHWVATWTAAPQPAEPDNLPPPPFTAGGTVLAGATLRQTLRVSAGGRRLRLRFSNAFGGTDLVLDGGRVALPAGGRPGSPAVAAGTSRPVTFGGRPRAVVPAGAQVVCDPVDVPLPAGASVTVTIHLPGGQPAAGGITSHPGSRTTSYLLPGHHPDFPERPVATPVDHWYFLSGAEVQSRDTAGAAVMLGDSLTDGRGSTTNGNDRWPDQLSDRLSRRPVPGVAIVNQGLGGNRVLRDGTGPSALARLDRDVLAVTGVRWLVVFEGVNDIGTADATAAAGERVAADLVFAYDQIVTRAHAAGVAVYGATLTPFGGNDPYDDPAGHREAARQAVNEWIRAGRRFDAVIDFDEAARDPSCARRLTPAFDTGDHLHLNPAGYAALAAAVPLGLFGTHKGPKALRN